MIDFDEEIRKFHKSLEIDEAEEAITSQDTSDMVDVLLKMTRDGVFGTESRSSGKKDGDE